MFDDDLYYVFDSHNRSSDGMCGDNTGTSYSYLTLKVIWKNI